MSIFFHFFYIEYNRTENAIREKLTFPSIKMEDGFGHVPNSPGLGIEVNESVLQHFLTTTNGEVIDIKQ